MTDVNNITGRLHTMIDEKQNGFMLSTYCKDQGQVVQNIVCLTSLLVVKMLTVLVSTISNSQVFLLKNVSSFL